MDTAVVSPTYYDRPLLKRPVWIWTVPAYFYVGGVAGAALVLGAAAQFADRDELRQLIYRTRWIGAVGLATGSALLIADLGRPERFMHMLRVVNWRSPLSIGSWILAAGGSLAGAAAVIPQKGKWRRVGDVAGCGAGILGIPLAGYTGVLLGTTAIPIWQRSRRTLPILFVASAAASCASACEMFGWDSRQLRIIHRFGLLGKTAELMGMLAVESELAQYPESKEPLKSDLPGMLWRASKVLTAASLAVTFLPQSPRSSRVAGMLGTIAGIAVRFAVFYAGFASARNPRAAQ